MVSDLNSSNINEVIRAVLNFLFLFYEKIFHAPKVQKVLQIFFRSIFLFLFTCKRFVLFVLVKFLNKEIKNCPNNLINITRVISNTKRKKSKVILKLMRFVN